VVAALAVAAVGAVVYAPAAVGKMLTRIGGGAELLAKFLPPTLAQATEIEKAYWLTQNWSARDRYWFHHTSQGSATFPIPYDWFIALERPELSLFSRPGYLRDEDYLRRMGFIPSPSKAEGGTRFGYHGDGPRSTLEKSEIDRSWPLPENSHELPVGFAKMRGGKDPTTGQDYSDQLGLTCAACHTGHIEYKKVSIRFDGGPGMVNLGQLETAIGLSIGYTLKIPFRFNRFADTVAKSNSRWSDKKALRKQLERVLDEIQTVQLQWERKILERNKFDHVPEGFARLDALNRIGNQVFFENMLPPGATKLPDHLAANFARIDAPVSFPPIWDVPWFTWAQYDASIFNELVRNAGEALGVKAKINMSVPSNEKLPLFSSSAEMFNIFRFEEMLRGENPFKESNPAARKFTGLIAPTWEEAERIFKDDSAWQLDDAKVARGRELYREHCFECHRGPVRDVEFDKLWPADSFWQEENPDRTAKGEKNWVRIGDRQYFNVVQKPLADIGTDRQQSRVLTERQIKLPPEIGVQAVEYLNAKWNCGLVKDDALNSSFALALMTVVDKALEQWFKDNNVSPEHQKIMWGLRPNCLNSQIFRVARPVDPTVAKPEIGIVVPHYRARPLDGVWATAPYLHNGSVPTLYDMLSPQNERPTGFCVGSRAFDPKKVGLVFVAPEDCEAGLSQFDSTQLGNSNLGHSFEGTESDVRKLPPGTIGRGLTPAEREALVEYLKTL
jgi:hypothetical protein